MARANHLRHLTVEDLEPAWNRREIPMARIAAALGVTRQGLSYRAKVLGMPSRAGNYDGQKKCTDAVFSRLWFAGVSLDDMASECGYSARQNVTQRRRMMGLPARTRSHDTGNHAGWATITIAEWHEMELAKMMADNPL